MIEKSLTASGIAKKLRKTRQQVIYLIRKHDIKPIDQKQTFANEHTSFYSLNQFLGL